MSYQVIARKYRPQRFSDVVGQEHVTQTLAHAIEQKRIAHAYLFCGPRGTGKTTIARIFAKCLNCTDGPKVDFDDQDPRCREIAEGRSLDVFEIDGASNNGVEQVRELRETCKYAPASSRFKIYIIDEVHMLSTAAFNALLKTLEEPPEHVKFMFATTDPEKVLPTILSRCQRFDLRRIPVALIEKHLTEIAGKENVKLDAPALYAIARGAEGGMRDAESTLDQLISFCGDKIEEADVLSMFGLVAQNQLLELARALLAGEVEGALRQLNDLSNHGKDLGRLLSDLLNHFRNLLIFQVSRGDLKMLEISESEAGSLGEQGKMATVEGLTRILEVLAEAEMRLRDAASKKILVEVAMLKAIEARNAVSLDAVLKQLQNLREGQGGEVINTPAPTAAQAPSPRPFRAAPRAPEPASTHPAHPAHPVHPAAAPVEAGAQHGVAVPTPSGPVGKDALWAALAAAVVHDKPLIGAYLANAYAISLSKNILAVGFDAEFEDQMGLVDQALLEAKLTELGHPNIHIKFMKVAAPARAAAAPPTQPVPASPSPPPTAKVSAPSSTPVATPVKEKPVPIPFNKDDFKNDPLIKKALEIFKGQIVEVRA
jgi:DNA polymerase-3 subunit gamma/tau